MTKFIRKITLNKPVPPVVSPFGVKALENDVVVGMTMFGTFIDPAARNYKYSADGVNWTPWDYEHDNITVPAGTTMYIVGDGNTVGTGESDDAYLRFTFSANCEVEGNIMTLIDITSVPTALPSGAFAGLFGYNGYLEDASRLQLPAITATSKCYNGMFQSCNSLRTAPATLPATTLAEGCYANMFNGCYSLTAAPTLPATTLAESCYQGMFENCYSLTAAPALPATTLAGYCYYNMFYGCTSLTSAPALPATTLADACYQNMFYGCTHLTSAPALPATTLAEGCYWAMFKGCTSLASAPATLPATTLAFSCYAFMFEDCSALTAAPALPATTLAPQCYSEMFSGCSALTAAPDLPATTLENNCYQYMFRNCYNLAAIKAMFLTAPGGNYTYSWVAGVAASGVFTKNANATWTEDGVDGIPTGWTVQTAAS